METHISNTAFLIHTLRLKIKNIFKKRSDILYEFEILEGMHVVDYGCGVGIYLPTASRLVRKTGLVTAVDTHPVAIQAVNEKAFRKKMTNVMGMLSRGGTIPVDDHTAHIVYSLDTFDTMKRPTAILQEIRRILDPDGYLYIGSKAPCQKATRKRILASRAFTIEATTEHTIKCRPSPPADDFF